MTWRDTGLLPDGRLRDIAAPLSIFGSHDPLGLAEKLVRDAVLEVVANG